MAGVESSPSAIAASVLGPDEAHLGGTPVGKSANSALRALSRAARAFALYDSKNVIIRRFLSEYRETMEAALARHGTLTFTVRPWELLLGEEVVYKEEDRERSLAFRLFRDGVRTLTLQPGLPWEECVHLLEILSVRFSGVRQQEDDVVTLLRKAGFTKIAFTAAEGFAPAEENPEPGLPAAVAAGHEAVVQAPSNFDQPLPAHGPNVGYGYREVPAPWLEAVRREEHPAAVPWLAARLAAELLTAASGPASPLSNAEVAPLCLEVRDYCIADGAYVPLLALVRSLKAQHGIGSDQLEPIVTGIGAPHVLGQLLDALPRDATEAPKALIDLLVEVPGNHIGPIVDRLNATEDPRLQLVLKSLTTGLAKNSSDSLIQSLHGADRQSASHIVEVLMVSAPEQAVSVAIELAQRDEPASQLEGLAILEKATRTDALSALLAQLATSPVDEVFARVADVMAAVHDRRGYDLLSRQAEARATAGTLTRASATAVGEALASLGPVVALARFKAWAHGKGGLLARLHTSAHDKWLQMIAVAGFAMMKVPEADALIKDVHAHTSDDELKSQCVSAAARHRKLFGAAHG